MRITNKVCMLGSFFSKSLTARDEKLLVMCYGWLREQV